VVAADGDDARVSEPDPGFRRLARICPHCGAREPTLGPRCPACGKDYEPGSWVDRVSESGDGRSSTGGSGAVVGGLLAVTLTLLSLIAQAVPAPLRWVVMRLARRRT
jgi:hypothetical protein